MTGLLLSAPPVMAATIGRSVEVISTIYDISLYNSELDRIMNEADSKGVYGGAGSTPVSRARDKSLTHATMQAQREAVLHEAATRLAANATDSQLDALLSMARGGATPADQTDLNAAVGNTKSAFSDALWEHLARAARGNSMFPCTKDQRGRC